jgi:hypothetical protein
MSHLSNPEHRLFKLKPSDCTEDCDDLVFPETAGLKIYSVPCSFENRSCADVIRNQGSKMFYQPNDITYVVPYIQDPFVCLSDVLQSLIQEELDLDFNQRKKGLSKGAIAGIAAGVVGSILLVGAGIGGFLWWRKSQK